MKGNLLSLEGISGTGKTFYRRKLEEEFKENPNVIFIKEIFDEAQMGLNKKIFSALFHTEDKFFNMGVPLTETMLLLSSSMYKYESTIKKALDEGKTVIEDRSLDTIAIYQAILIAQKNGGNPLQIADDIYSFARKFRRTPDKTFLLQGQTDFVINRAEERDKSSYSEDEIKLLKRANALYSLYAQKNPQRIIRFNVSRENTDDILKRMKSEIDRSIQINEGEKEENEYNFMGD